MFRELRVGSSVLVLLLGGVCGIVVPSPALAQTSPVDSALPSASQGITLDADRIEYSRETEVYDADGSVVFVQGDTRLTADHAKIRMLTGQLIATGRVHLTRQTTEVRADQLEVNINTEAGIITNGRLFNQETNASISGRVIHRFSEDHYRARDGSFTNCDAMEGQTPAWRFTFEDADANIGDRLYLRGAWFCVHDVPIIPIPRFNYPIGVTRKTGFLLPTPGYSNQFGFTYRQGFFWNINPSQDMTITPLVYSKRAFGGDVEYRYILSRQTKGQWLVNAIQDTDQRRARGFIAGTHTSQVTPTLSARVKVAMVSDRTYPQDFANSGALRALPSADSNLDIRKQFGHGSLYLLGQYLQPVADGGTQTFQRLPEVGHRLLPLTIFKTPLYSSMDSTFVHFYREAGFNLSRLDFVPLLASTPLNIGQALNLTPQVKPRAVLYTRGSTTGEAVERATFWASVRGDTRLRRRFRGKGGGILTHTIEPDVIYEFVPFTDQSDIVQVDNVDNLPRKNLLTYSLRSGLSRTGLEGASNWLTLVLAQSYQVSNPRATPTEDLPIEGQQTLRRFSNLWTRALIGDADYDPRSGQTTSSFLVVDSFFDTYQARFTQLNTDLRFQYRNAWYVQVGQRFTRSGPRVQRGDIWNPLSFGEVFDPTPGIEFVTASGAVKLPLGFTTGVRVYRDIAADETPELDVVGLYQNPCRCWSAGFYFIRFPDRNQFSFLINLTGIGNTDSLGTQLLKDLLGPLLQGERGLPW